MKILLVGDVHAKAEDIDDCRALLRYIADVADRERADEIVFLGDQNHHHSIVQVEVQQFWLESLPELLRGHRVVRVLVGNHDQAGNGDPFCHSMLPYGNLVQVIDSPLSVGGILYMPYTADQTEFIRVCNEFKDSSSLLICHQTFSGSKYENGFFAKDGVNPDLIPQDLIVSGHIHSPQEFGKVWYPGSPRWQTISDANIDRSIWILDPDTQDRTAFSTNGICRRILHLVDSPDASVSLPEGTARVMIDIKGPASYIEQRKKELAGSGARIRTFPTDTKPTEIRESDGIATAFQKFFDQYEPKYLQSKDLLKSAIEEALNDRR